jgi:hypothetical protein
MGDKAQKTKPPQMEERKIKWEKKLLKLIVKISLGIQFSQNYLLRMHYNYKWNQKPITDRSDQD